MCKYNRTNEMMMMMMMMVGGDEMGKHIIVIEKNDNIFN
jgi:hypothetical protein